MSALNVCFIQVANYHTEILGVFMHLLKQHNLYLYHPHTQTSNFSYLQHYEKALQVKVNTVRVVVPSKYDIIIFLTAREAPQFRQINRKHNHNKVRAICHCVGDITPQFHNVALSPLLKLPFIVPFAPDQRSMVKALTTWPPRRLELVAIGWSSSNHAHKTYDQVETFMRQLPSMCFLTIFASRNVPAMSNKIKTLPRVKLIINAKANTLMAAAQRAHFILTLDKLGGFYHTQGLSGAVPIALRFAVPLLCTVKLASIYKLKGALTYKRNLNECCEELSNMTLTTYQQLLAHMINSDIPQIERANRAAASTIFTKTSFCSWFIVSSILSSLSQTCRRN